MPNATRRRRRELAQQESDPQRKQELERIAEVCTHVPAHAPRDFWEALQYYWFVHLGVTTELNTWDSFNPGHLDQHLDPFYQRGSGRRDADARAGRRVAAVLLDQVQQPARAAQSGRDGGGERHLHRFRADQHSAGVKDDGSDGVNEVTYLLLDVIEEMRLLQPSSSIQVSKKNPDRFVKRAAKIIRTGFGQPSVFNTDLIVQEMVRQGKSMVDARAGGTSGCVETGAFGKENYNLTGYFNLPKVLEITLHNGVDPRTGKADRAGDRRRAAVPNLRGAVRRLREAAPPFHRYQDARQQRDRAAVCQLHARAVSVAADRRLHRAAARIITTAARATTPPTSRAWVSARITDALTAIKYHVFDRKTLSDGRAAAASGWRISRATNACGNCCSTTRRVTATTTITPTR